MGAPALMRVVLDSNILLSALISPHGAPHRIFEAWQERRFALVTCPTQLDEVWRASRYPKLRAILQPHRVGAMVNALRAAALPDPPLAGHEADDPETPGCWRWPNKHGPTGSSRATGGPGCSPVGTWGERGSPSSERSATWRSGACRDGGPRPSAPSIGSMGPLCGPSLQIP